MTLLRLTHLPRILLATLLALALSGCFHNDDDPPPAPPPVPDANPTGYYDKTNGTTSVSDGAGGTIELNDLQAMVDGTRIMMLSANNKLLYDGTMTITGNDFTANFTIYTDGESPISAPASGTITAGSGISGTLSGTGVGSGTFNLLYANTNDQAAEVVFRWLSTGGGGFDEFGFIIDGAGSLSHDESAAFSRLFGLCEMNGTVTPVSGTRLYRADVELTECNNFPAVNGTAYTGLVTTKDGIGTNDRLVYMVSDGRYTLSGEFDRD